MSAPKVTGWVRRLFVALIVTAIVSGPVSLLLWPWIHQFERKIDPLWYFAVFDILLWMYLVIGARYKLLDNALRAAPFAVLFGVAASTLSQILAQSSALSILERATNVISSAGIVTYLEVNIGVGILLGGWMIALIALPTRNALITRFAGFKEPE